MKVNKRELLTIPNAITTARLIASPFFAKKLYNNPRAWWLPSSVLAATDLEGNLARLGDGIKNPNGTTYRREPNERLANLGFRGSEVGRKLDAATDRIFGAEMVVAGLAKGIIPKWLGYSTLAQNALVTTQTLYYEAKGLEPHVTKAGQLFEAATDIGIGLVFAGESVDDPVRKQQLRVGGMVIAGAGLVGKSYAAFYQYRNEAHQKMAELQATA